MIDLKNTLDSEGFDLYIHIVPIRLVPLIGVLYRAKRMGVRNDMAQQIIAIIRKFSSIHRTTIVAHSYSTYLLTWWLNEQPIAKLRNIILLAPIVRRSEIAELTNIADQVVVDAVVSDKIPCIAEAIRLDKYEATGSFGTRGQVALGGGALLTRFFLESTKQLKGWKFLQTFPQRTLCGTGHSFHLNIDHFRQSVLPIAMDQLIPSGTTNVASLTQATVHRIRWTSVALIILPIMLALCWSIYAALAVIIVIAVMFFRS
jgi:pimeloyl-ACP methyl ester carboxylesterase